MQVEEKYMQRCLELAQSGKSSVAPNPMVGAVIVHKGRIIGEGFHRQYGSAHAEVNAIHAVKDKSLLRDSTLYVNLEPCAHEGKTPPCTALIIRKQIPKVVIGCSDPFPQVAGRGIKILRDAGVEVVTDMMRDDATALNRFFMTAHTKQRPYVIIKWAQSSDGYIDRIRNDASERPAQLSNAATCRYVHKLRSEVSAIMVGTNTAWLDNPTLTVRRWDGPLPVRIFIDRMRRIPLSHHLLDGATPTLVFTEDKRATSPYPFQEGTENVPLDFSRPVIPQILRTLYERKLFSLLVEGGACLHTSFLTSRLWDELQIETAPVKLRSGVKSPVEDPSKIADFQKNIYFSSDGFHKENQSFVSKYYSKEL